MERRGQRRGRWPGRARSGQGSLEERFCGPARGQSPARQAGPTQLPVPRRYYRRVHYAGTSQSPGLAGGRAGPRSPPLPLVRSGGRPARSPRPRRGATSGAGQGGGERPDALPRVPLLRGASRLAGLDPRPVRAGQAAVSGTRRTVWAVAWTTVQHVPPGRRDLLARADRQRLAGAATASVSGRRRHLRQRALTHHSSRGSHGWTRRISMPTTSAVRWLRRSSITRRCGTGSNRNISAGGRRSVP